MKNNKKQIIKNDVDKKTIFIHKIQSFMNFILNDLLKLINIFNINLNWKLEKVETEITR